MPPPKSNRFHEQKLMASRIFVDREEPKAVYAHAIEDLKNAPDRPHLLSFYGVGGQGKTKLCLELIRMSGDADFKADKLRCALIDLHANRPSGDIHAWVSLRNAIAAATGARFPCFDIAYADYWSQVHPEKQPATLGQSRLAGLGGDLKDSVADGASGIASDAAGGTVGEMLTDVFGGIPFVGPLLKRTSKWAIAKGYEALLKANARALENLYGPDYSPDPLTIAGALPDILAHELALHQRKHPDQRLIILIDEYENAMPSGGSRGVLSPDPWDRALRDFVTDCHGGEYRPRDGSEGYPYKAGFLLILFGREKIRWEEIDADWQTDWADRQHLLEGLGASDADDFLIQAGVAEPLLRDAITAAATAPDPATGKSAVYPIMLDLGTQIYFNIRASGKEAKPEDLLLKSASYVDRRRELFARFMRNYRDVAGLESLLRRLACAREFTRETVRFLVDQFAIPFDLLHFADLAGLSFVNPVPDGRAWVIHNHIRETLLESLPAEDRRETHRALAEWYTERGTPSDSRLMTLDHARALGEGIVQYAELGQVVPDGDRKRTQHPVIGWIAAIRLLLEPSQAAQAMLIEALPPEHPNIAHSMNNVAMLHHQLREYDTARTLYERALLILREALPSEHRYIADSLNNLATLRYHSREYETALQLYQEALAIRRSALTADHPDVAYCLNNLATVHQDLLEYDKARPLYEEALMIRRKALPADHSDTASSLNNLGNLYQNLADYEAARPFYEEALAIYRKVLPPDHPHIAHIINNLAILHSNLGEHDAARRLCEDALAIYRKSLPLDHPSIADALYNLAKEYKSLHASEQALLLYEEALQIERKALPSDHPNIVNTINDIVSLHESMQSYDRALPLSEEVLAIRRKVLPPGEPELADSLDNVAILYCHLKAYDTARSLYEDALAIRKKALPADHHKLAENLYNLALTYQKLLDYEKARPLYEEVLAIWRKALPPDHPNIVRTINTIKTIVYIEDGISARTIRTKIPGTSRHLQHSASWPWSPMTADVWREPTQATCDAVLNEIDAWHQKTDSAGLIPFSVAYSVDSLRVAALPFWPREALWVEGLAKVADEVATFHGLWLDGQFAMGVGSRLEVEAINARTAPDLSTAELRLAYLRYFCSWGRGADGRFAIIQNEDCLTPFMLAAKDREAAMAISSRQDEKMLDDGRWIHALCIIIGDVLLECRLILAPNGMVEMADAEPIDLGGITLTPEHWYGPFRRAGWASPFASLEDKS